MDSMLYWIWLSLACTPGGTSFARLHKQYPTPEEIYRLDGEALGRLLGNSHRDIAALSEKDLSEAERVFRFCIEKQVGILHYDDPAFPPSLRAIKNPPVLLYYRGKLPDFSRGLYVGIVGTRALTEYGKRTAFIVGHDLSVAGATVVSGMAIGIDGVAMAGALYAGKPTVAVIGSGIDVCYPPEHLTLAREIVKEGCVLTEYAPGSKPMGFHFPQRNRIISGLCRAITVVEGRENSGSLITAHTAKEQGKTIYAVPGNVDTATSAAANLLIRDGARLLFSADDIIRDFSDGRVEGIHPSELSSSLRMSQATIEENLARYKIACVTVNDKVFRPSIPKPSRDETALPEKPKKKRAANPPKEKKTEKPEKKSSGALDEPSADVKAALPSDMDKTLLALYQKIPAEQEIQTESLVGEDFSLRDVMRGLLKLEMLGLIVSLPGEKVRRV